MLIKSTPLNTKRLQDIYTKRDIVSFIVGSILIIIICTIEVWYLKNHI
jgi:hypothetical protein